MGNSTLSPTLKTYAQQHLKSTKRSGIYTVRSPMYVFKKVYTLTNMDDAIANLIIPIGATVHIPNVAWVGKTYSLNRPLHGKFRASEAFVHSLVTIETNRQINRAVSGHDENFVYTKGETVYPTRKFSLSDEGCHSGIHFFVDLQKALAY